MDLPTELRLLAQGQSQVLAWRQLLESGLAPHDVRRLLRRRVLVRLLPRVYLTHTGEPTWLQRAWAAVLYAEPAALWGESALRLAGPEARRTDGGTIHVGVDHSRVLRAPTGIVVHRRVGFGREVVWYTAPPRQDLASAVVDLAAAAPDRMAAVGHLADAVGARVVSAEQVGAALVARTRVRDRAFLAAVISDVASGACSVLEQGYLQQVERAHGLPTARRQVRANGKGPLCRDVVYEAFGIIVELDGRLFHSRVADRDRDLDRDLDAALAGLTTARLGWGQVYGRPCETAAKVGALLAAHGWEGGVRRCAEPTCVVPQ